MKKMLHSEIQLHIGYFRNNNLTTEIWNTKNYETGSTVYCITACLIHDVCCTVYCEHNSFTLPL